MLNFFHYRDILIPQEVNNLLSLYENIKKFRLQAKMSQDELARRTGYTDRSSIAKVEKGMVDLSQSKIKQFADALGVTQGELLGWDEDKKETVPEDGLSESKRQLLALAESCTEEDAEKLLQMMQILLGKK